jgi:hypothetical protein
MEKLQALAKDKKDAITRNKYSKSIPLAQYYDQEKLTLMETLIEIIQQQNERIQRLEAEMSYKKKSD